MRKPRGVQIRANRLIGPGKCLVGTIDECPPRGEVVQRPTEAAQEPRGSGPLPSTPARARGSSVRATPSLHPPRILKTISLFYRKEDPEKSRLRGRLQLFFLSLVWGFPIVAAGIPFVVDQCAMDVSNLAVQADLVSLSGHKVYGPMVCSICPGNQEQSGVGTFRQVGP